MTSSFAFNVARAEIPFRCPRCGVYDNADVVLSALPTYHSLGVVRQCAKCHSTYICKEAPRRRGSGSMPVMMYTVTPLLVVCERCTHAMRIRFVDPEPDGLQVLLWLECHDKHLLATVTDAQLARARASGDALMSNTIRILSDEEATRCSEEAERQAEKWMYLAKLLERFGKGTPPRPGEKI